MHNIAFFVPLVLAVELNEIAFTQLILSWSKINIVSYQHSIPCCQFDNKFLVPAAIVVVRQQLDNNPLTRNLHVASSV